VEEFAGAGPVDSEYTETWSEAEKRVMLATYRALLEHGYADLSIARIAEELDQSKSAVYHHYDSKEDLLISFLAYATDRFEAVAATEAATDADEALDGVVERLLPLRPTEERRQIGAVLVALRAEAVTNDAFRAQFTRVDELLATTLRETVARGIESGEFRDVDAGRIAEHVLAIVFGAMQSRATTDRQDAVAAARVSLAAYLDRELRRQ
jgi:AcrR family transcriptional regulator